MRTCKLININVHMYEYVNESQRFRQWEHENEFNYMGEVAPAPAMLILPTEGLHKNDMGEVAPASAMLILPTEMVQS